MALGFRRKLGRFPTRARLRFAHFFIDIGGAEAI